MKIVSLHSWAIVQFAKKQLAAC